MKVLFQFFFPWEKHLMDHLYHIVLACAVDWRQAEQALDKYDNRFLLFGLFTCQRTKCFRFLLF